MSSICEEQHKFQLQPSHQLLSLKKSLRDIDIPPRKLLTRRAAIAHDGAAAAAADMFSDETLLRNYLPHNKLADSDSDDSDDPYSSDHFRMYEFKVRRCTRSRSHDWTDCPFAHPGEKARRRDPRRYHYSGTVCPEYRRDGACHRGDACEFSHGVFECWLHPARYRTEACKDGKSCKRKVCFFAHTPRQLRILPLNFSSHVPSNDTVSCCNNHIGKNDNNNKSKFFNNNIDNPSSKGSNSNHCCLFCHCCSCSSISTCSPTSTLFGMSHFSPPMSPSSPASSSHCVGVNHHHGVNVSYKDVLTDIMCSFEGLNFGEASSSSPVSSKAQNNVMPWLHDVCCEDHPQLQQQFVLSPSGASSSSSSSSGCEDHKQHFNILSPTITSSAGSPSFSNGGYSSGKLFRDESKVVDDVSASSCPPPDLGWVNELLM